MVVVWRLMTISGCTVWARRTDSDGDADRRYSQVTAADVCILRCRHPQTSHFRQVIVVVVVIHAVIIISPSLQ